MEQRLTDLLDQIEDPALREILRHIIEEQGQIKHSQEKVIEALIIQLMGNDPTKIDLRWIVEYLNNR